MSDSHQLAASIIRHGARALAGYAVQELLTVMPTAAQGFGDDPFVRWQQWLVARLEELGAALALGRPRLFQTQVQWGRTALEARRLSPQAFRASLEVLAGVLHAELPPAAGAVAADYIQQALDAFDTAPPAASDWLTSDTPHARLASAYLLATLDGDARRAGRVILDAARDGHCVTDLYLRVLIPAQEEVGRLWLANELSIAEEHFATVTARRVMAQLSLLAPHGPLLGKTVLAAGVAGNQHDLGLLVVGDFLEMDGWGVIQLGADVPISSILEAIECFHVDLLALSAAMGPHLQTLRETITAVRRSPPGGKLKTLVGGQALNSSPDLARELGADGFADDPLASLGEARRLLDLSAEIFVKA